LENKYYYVEFAKCRTMFTRQAEKVLKTEVYPITVYFVLQKTYPRGEVTVP
jgi:hypothetical protein